MPRSSRKRSSTGIYHIVLRGINRQRIFEEDEDYQKFLYILNENKKQSGFKLYAWCLMPNHIHLLLKEDHESISETIRKIGSGFVYWYNAKYKRVGHLFQDRFGSEVVEDESYFLTVFRYIHLNPTKAGLCRTPDEWRYSSYSHYFDGNEETDNILLFHMIEKRELERFHQEKNDDLCLDFDHKPVRKITDEQAEKIVMRESGCGRISQLQFFPPEQRDPSIRALLKAGASVYQISRLTGISVSIIQKIKGKK